MYTNMNQDQNQQAPQHVQQYGNTLVAETAPPPLQPLHNYTTYELVGAGPEATPVIYQNETANIIVSAMQVPGQEELVFFHDQPSVTDLGGAYTIEIEPSPAEYYTEQATQHHVLTYETLQQPSQHQQVIIQQQQLQQLPPPQQQVIQQPPPQEQQQHVIETQQMPSGQILKQQLQQNAPNQIRGQQVVMQQTQAPRPRMVQQTHLQQQQVYVQQQHHPQQAPQQQYIVQQQPQQQNQQLVQQQQFVQQNHQPKQQIIQQSGPQQHYVQQNMKPIQSPSQPHYVQKQQHYIQQPPKPPMIQQQTHYVQKPMQQPGGSNVQTHFVQSPQQQQQLGEQQHSVIINQMEPSEQQQRINWEHQQNQMHLNQSPQHQQQYSAPPTPEMQQQPSPQQMNHQQVASPQQSLNHHSPQQQQQQFTYVVSPMPQPPVRIRGKGPATPRPARQQAPRPPGSAGQPARPMTPGTPQGTLVRPMGNGPRPARNSNPRPPRPPRIQQGPAATLTRAQGQAPPRQYAPHSQRFAQQQRFMSNNLQQGDPQLIQQQPSGHQQQLVQQQNQQNSPQQQQQQMIKQQQPLNGQKYHFILKAGNQSVEVPGGSSPGPGEQMFVEDPNNPGPRISVSPNSTLQIDPAKIKTVHVPKAPGSPGAKQLQGIPIGKPTEITSSELKNVKILITPANSNQMPNRVRSPMNQQQGPRLLNMGLGQRAPGAAPEYRLMSNNVATGPNGPGSPRPPYPQANMRPQTVNVTPRQVTFMGATGVNNVRPVRTGAPRGGPIILRPGSMSPRPQQSMSPRPPHLMGAPGLVRTPGPNQMGSGNHMGSEESQGSPAEATMPIVKEEKDQYKPGLLALCPNCGYLSARINRCSRCSHKIPSDTTLHKDTGIGAPGTGTAGGGAGPKPGGKDSPAVPGSNSASDVNSPKSNSNSDTPSSGSQSATVAPPAPRTRGRKAQEEPPEILLISSDEEDHGDEDWEISSAKSFPPPLSDKEPQMNDYELPPSRVCGGGIPDDNVLDTPSEDGKYTHLLCRTIRIGSLKVFPKERVFISSHGIKLTIPLKESLVQVKIYRHEIVKVLAHFGKGMPVIFYYIRAHVGPRIREQLGMNKQSKCYFDPSSRDETHRRITLLPEKIPDEVKSVLSVIYSKDPTISPTSDEALLDTGPCLEELSIKEANNILVKSSPPELRNLNSSAQPVAPPQPVAPAVKTIFIYRTTGISINSEDYACLDREQFINDVIIDFYLGFLLQEMATPQIRATTHIFSTFFYKRLTQKPTRKVQGSIENDPSVSAAKKRHSRVQSWTKNINVFEKDYIVVPINSNAHWFLAIICFPGLSGCETLDGRAVEECQRFKSVRKREKMKLDELQRTGKSGTVTIGNTTISPVTKPGAPSTSSSGPATTTTTPAKDAPATSAVPLDEEEANRDEAESEGEDFADASQESASTAAQGDSQRAQSPLRDYEGPVRHPCILIFDSLPQAGNSRVRVVATLRDWLAVEYEVKHNGATRDFSKNVFIGAKPKVPMQTNYYDCGLYLLHYAERFFLDPLVDYRLPILLENWFSAYDTHRKRYDLQHLLFVLMERQGIDKNSLNLPILNLNDPDYKSPEHEAEPPDMLEAKYHAASHDGRDEEEDGREEAEGDEEMMGDEEEDEDEEALDHNAPSIAREEGESNNCDMSSSTELDTTGDHDVTEDESLVTEEDYVEEEEAEATPAKVLKGVSKAASLTKQITITPMGVKLRQISVTTSPSSTSSFSSNINTPPVRLVHIPRPKSKQIIHSSSPPASTLQLVIPPAPATGKTPNSNAQGAGGRNVAVLQHRNITIKRKLSSPAPSPANNKKQATPIAVSKPAPASVTVTPAQPAKKPAPTTTPTPNAASLPNAIKKPTPTPATSPTTTQMTASGSSNLRNMRIVKKTKAEDGEELEEEVGES